MRTTTAAELAVLGSLNRTVTLRVKVANGSGTMIDWSSWVERVTIDHDVDQPVGGCTIEFSRASGQTQSLSPLRTDSTLNRLDDGATYSPAIDLNRSVTVEVATTAIGASIVSGDYKLQFKGTIDVVNFEHSPVSVICRDLGAPLVDRWIETEANYGTGGGRAIELVMQDILDAVFGAGVYPLYTPSSPGFNVVTYRQQKMSVMDALQDLVQLIGWDVRFKWDDGTNAFRLTLSQPPRTKTTPDYTFGPSSYIDIARANLDLTNIRNVITGSFRDMGGSPPGNRATITRSDATSITKYGRRFFYIQEADVSPIDTSAEMTTMLDSALADLKDPKGEYEVESPFHWPVDLSDLNRYPGNLVHHNTNQDFAVVGFTHDLSRKSHRTKALVRGSPIGQYATWLGRGGTMGGGGAGGPIASPPYPFITPLNTEADQLTWNLRFNALNGSGGGGVNLTYTVKRKKDFASETTLSSGNASAFPLDLAVARDPKQNAVLTFRVTDTATGLFAEETYSIPAYSPFVDATGLGLTSGATDSGGRPLNRHLAKPSAADPDNLDSVPEGTTYKKTLATRINLGRPVIDFTEAIHTGKTLDNVGDGATWKRVVSVNGSGKVTQPSIEAASVGPVESVGRNRCKVYNSGDWTTTTATPFLLTWDSEVFDSNALHSTVTNPGRITIPTGGNVGFWIFSAQVAWVANTVGARELIIRKNGVDIANNKIAPALSGLTIQSVIVTDDAPTVGDYYEAWVTQSSGGNLNANGSGANVSWFSAVHLW